MGERTSIGWTDHTFNHVWGCSRVSPGCEHCYAETFSARVGHGKSLPQIWGVDAARRPMSDEYWRQPLKWNRAAEKAGERRRVFCASMADVFEIVSERNVAAEAVMFAARARLWPLIAATPWLDWLLLTKRPQNVMRLVPEVWAAGFPENVWLGVTAEDQRRADERIPILVSIPAHVRFVSHEPALEAIEIPKAGVHWVITGGESGPGARPYDIGWARDIVRQCKAAGTACFVKQLGSMPHITPDELRCRGFGGLRVDDEGGVHLRDRKGGSMEEWPEDLRVREWPR